MVAVVKKTTLTPNDVAVDDSNKTADLLGGPESKSVIVNDANDRMLPPNFGFVSRQAGWKNEQPTERYLLFIRLIIPCDQINNNTD